MLAMANNLQIECTNFNIYLKYFAVMDVAEMRAKMTLDKLSVGSKSKITAVGGQGALRRRLLDMGLTPRTEVLVRKVAPMGDPIEINIRGYELTLRKEDARNIEIMEVAE